MLQLICIFYTTTNISVNLIYLQYNKGIWNKVTTNHGSCDKDFLKNSPKWMNPKFWKFWKINVQKDAVHRSLFVLKCLKFCLVHFSLAHSLSRTHKHTQISISLTRTHTLSVSISCLSLPHYPKHISFFTHTLSLSFFCFSQWILKWNLCL